MPEQADAYVGTDVGLAVTWRGTRSKMGSGAASRFAFAGTEEIVNVLVTVATDDLVTVLENLKLAFHCWFETIGSYTVAGVTVSLKKEEQSAAPDLVGKELATIARRQLSLLQTESVLVAAAVSCATQRTATYVERIVMFWRYYARKVR